MEKLVSRYGFLKECSSVKEIFLQILGLQIIPVVVMLELDLGRTDQEEKEGNFKDVEKCYNLSEQNSERDRKEGLKG